jgi:acetyl-CoA carboxylase carboxyl transferase subunit beta
MSQPTVHRDWRQGLLAGSSPLPGSAAIRCAVTTVDDVEVVVAAWEFGSHGGSFGVADADAFVAVVATAVERQQPLVTILRSGGTRLDEGLHALVGIPRAAVALRRLRAAGLAHVAVADHPTTGGVWVAVGSQADVRIAVADSLIGFSGPRAIAAMTERDLPSGANRAASAYDAGLVDLVVEPHGVAAMLGRALVALTRDEPESVAVPTAARPPVVDGWDQVLASRASDRPDGAMLLTRLLSSSVALRGADQTVAARVGQLAGRRVVGVALAAARATMPTPAGFALLSRAARLAGALDLGLVILVDTPGADPHTEADGLVPAIATALNDVLTTAAPAVTLVHGEGGSGGALAGAVTDLVGVGASGWFAALSPEGAAATLRIEPDAAARLMAVTPADLLASGFADGYVPAGQELPWLVAALDRLREVSSDERLERRLARWSGRLPG